MIKLLNIDYQKFDNTIDCIDLLYLDPPYNTKDKN